MADYLYRIENGKVHLKFHPGQARAWQSQQRFTLILAGTQGGKTSFGPWWLWREIQKKGAGDYIAVTTSFKLFLLKMLPELQKVFCDVLGIGMLHRGAGVIQLADPETGEFWARHSYERMWGRILLMSVNSESGLEAATAKAAWLDECGQDDWQPNHWEAILRRLSTSRGRVLGTTTIYNEGFVKSNWYDMWESGHPDYNVIQFPSYINPSFPQEEYLDAKARMPDWRFKMFYKGEFSKPAGLILHDFKDYMIVPDTHIPLDWKRMVGFDPGGANMAGVYLALNPDDNRWYLYKETLEGNTNTKTHVSHALDELLGVEHYRAVGGSPSESQFRRDWTSHGLRVLPPGKEDVESGISDIITLIKDDRLRIFKSCNGIRHQIATYRRKLDDLGEPTDQIVDKATFHFIDALRYACTRIYNTGWSRGPAQ